MYANKRLGQHFLHDPAVIARILAAIAARPGEHLVEIGPGRGALTRPLAASGARLTVIELDRGLAAALAADPALAAVEVIVADALRTDYTALAGGAPLRIVGNLPYNISSPLLFRLLEAAARIRDLTLMLQREVVERMVAAPATRAYGRLTVMLAARCRVERLFVVGAGAFVPAPKVESAVVRLVPHLVPPFDWGDWELFEQLVRAGFSARRKTLRNALQAFADAKTIEAAGLDAGARPGTLAAADYARLSCLVASRGVACDFFGDHANHEVSGKE
ncbi:MAG TPA: 16S rRNA (adenine(1518)-N(6)/adenine(1519)-N(6))-dimethyltransferase RsmA [Gammaproteobacteria bacterium]|nr:16S rRNA (adenine(1518)-N(6)/adenine(1519)-N(6))-dimethyltransferase RsmA [Gammaproteobacteria bacterium]